MDQYCKRIGVPDYQIVFELNRMLESVGKDIWGKQPNLKTCKKDTKLSKLVKRLEENCLNQLKEECRKMKLRSISKSPTNSEEEFALRKKVQDLFQVQEN